MAENVLLISGCSGGGTSTLPEALAARGLRCVPEPGRRIIREEQERGGEALRWIYPRAFARRASAVARSDLAEAAASITFVERGPVDAAVALAHAGGLPLTQTLDPVRAYARTVFLAPPWPEICRNDDARQHCSVATEAWFHRRAETRPTLGNATSRLPRASADCRVGFVPPTLDAQVAHPVENTSSR